MARTLAITMLALLACATIAFAAGPLKGRTYTGTLAQGHVRIVLKVSGSGRSVLVSAPYAPLFCEPGGAGERVIARPVPIAANGRFSGTISYELRPTHAILSRLIFSGRFSGAKVTGTGRSEFLLAAIKHCGGTTSFSAKAKKK
jgi:hypothetical protein